MNISYSIIIPHYNIPALLIRCLNSIPIRQDIQVIVVDDCSPGADSYFKQYPEFKRPYLEWYSTPMGGSAGRARNIGLDKAKGKWIICIDADDFFVDNLEEILDEALSHTEDILYYNYHSVFSDNINKPANRDYYQKFFIQYEQDHDEAPFRYNFEVIWCKIIRNDLIQNHHIRCDETKYGNDFGLSIKIGYFAKDIAIINKPLFIITQRNDSLAASYFTGKKMSLEECRIRTVVAMKNQNFIDSKRIGIEINTFKSLKTSILRDYPFSFFKLVTRYLFIYPYACYRMLSYWWYFKINAVIKYFKMAFSI